MCDGPSVDLVAVIPATRAGIGDDGNLEMSGVFFEWAWEQGPGVWHPVVVLVRDPEPCRLVASVHRGSGVEVTGAAFDSGPIASRHGFAIIELEMALEPGPVRVEVGVEGSDAPPVWVEVEIRSRR
jgi:hypothetical protein